ncbi:MAG: hypothetical protein UW37_C0001G0009 [Candidatus Gottesmanbacteria bacterium GW2011_GWA2_44_17]|uniref:Uncharacterized protein n=1 Tax=Candidatus Gottesmanbacteria bacterium GW2011_GWA2_44_17 TaxID=1618444 RepID=A0A0G1KJA1_9BACT|nr:MAG: hypothetical protein UW37_C0001G0009 [Candidatus Gottesmanbacteria bacterium GW2011_GWA2_44_17]
MKQFLVSLLLILIPLQLGFLYLKNPSQLSGTVAGISRAASNIENSVSIGEFRFSLFGYTSPKALVTIEGMGIFDQTVANDKGYFQFNNRFSPFSSREACLNSKDQFGRLSSPLCLPPFPVNYNVDIGPVIMPPTLSLDKQDYFVDDEVILSGQAVPNTQVNLSMFGNTQKSNLALIKSVEAFTFPLLDIRSDSKGNFSISLPSSSPEKFRLFAQTDFKKSVSPNSVKLNLEILPIWMIIIKFFLFLLSLLRPRLLEITIIAEIIYIFYILKGHFQKKAIVLYQSCLPSIEEDRSIAVIKLNEHFLMKN